MEPGGSSPVDESENKQRQDKDNHQTNGSAQQSREEPAQKEVAQSLVLWTSASRRTLVLVITYVGIFVLFLTLACFVHAHPILSLDVAITQEFQEQQLPWLKSFMAAVSFLGSQILLFVLLHLLTAALFWFLRLRLEALFLLSLPAVSLVLNQLIKFLVNRPRPTSSLVKIFQSAYGQSFPSSHVMSYVAYWGLLFSLGFILLKWDRWWHYLLLLIPSLFVLLVGPSRIYLGDHWASDVLGGYLFGGLLLGVALWLYLYLRGKGVLR